MGVLTAVAAPVALGVGVFVSACYAPKLGDCTVSCASDLDCARSQICGGDGLCARPAQAGNCQPIAPSDAVLRDVALIVDAPRPPPPPPPPPPHDAAPDAPRFVNLHVTIDGRGRVDLDGGPTCDSELQDGDCVFALPVGIAQTLRAVETHSHDHFDGWTSMTCGGEGPTCVVTLQTATDVSARFEHH